MKNRFRSVSLIATLVMFVSGSAAPATTLYWDLNGATANTAVAVTGAWNGTNVLWNTSSTGGTGTVTAATTAADDLIFSSGTGYTTGTVTASGTRLASSITFEDNIAITLAGPVTVGGTGASKGIFALASKSTATTVSGLVTLASAATIQSGAGAFTSSGGINIGANALTINHAAAGRLQLSGAITGTGAVTVNGGGSGDYVPAQFNTYTGGTTLNAGSIVAVSFTDAGAAGSPDSGSFGAGPAPLVLNGGQLRSGTGASFTIGSTVTLAADTTFYTIAGEKSLAFSGPMTITGATRTLTSAVGTTVVGTAAIFNGAIGEASAGLGIIKAGLGNVTFNGTNTYTGTTTVNAGVLSIATTGALPGWNANGGFAIASGATLAVQNGVSDVGVATMVGGTTNFSAGAFLGYDTTAGNRAVAANLTDSPQGMLGLTKVGPNTLTLSGTNTYTGNTTVNLGTLSIASTAALPGWNVAGRFAVQNGATLAVQNAVSDADLATLLATPNFAAGASLGFDTAGGNRAYGPALNDSSLGALGLAKIGTGTLTLTGANTYTGATTVSGGTLVAAGGSAATGNIVVGNTTDPAVLNVVTGGTITGGTITAGTVAGAFGAVNITGGTLTLATPDASTDAISFGGGEGAYGAFTMSSGTFTQPRLMFGGTGTTTTLGGVGVGLITGGTVNSNGWFIIGRAGASTGVLTITGGTINHANASNALSIGLNGSGRAELNVAGGTIDNTGRNVTFSGGTGGTFHWSGTGVLNLNAGTLIAPAIVYDANAASAAASSYVNFSGGTLKASNATTALLPAFTPTTGVNRVFVNGAFGSFTGGAVIDTNGFNDTISANLLAPTGFGITSLSVSAAGSGYIGAPAVQILDGGLPSTATAYAVVGTDPANATTFGKVTSVVITNPGVIVGTPSVNLIGGGGSGAAITVTGTGPNTSGGLTKAGLGTLTLTGANDYTGPTTVLAGTLTVAGTGSLAASNGLSVSSGAQFNYLPTAPGTLTLGTTGTLTLGNGSAIGTTFGSTIAAPGGATVSGVVNLALSGAFTPGTAYPVLSAAGGLNAATYNVLNPTDFIFAQNVTPTVVEITPTAVTALATAHWVGGFGGNPGVWAASNGSTASNWTSDGAGTATPLVPGAAANVIFSDGTAAAGNQLNMTLGADMTINSLTINSANPVSLLKVGIPMLTLGSTAGSGITVNAGAGAVTLNPDMILGNAQTWTNNSSNTLVVGGALNNGANLLTLGGTGATTFANLTGGSGGLTISAGTTTLTTATLTGTQTWTNNSTSSGLSVGSINTNGFVVTVAGTGVSAITGAVSGGGGVTKTGTGTLTLSGSSSYLGATNVSGGVLEVTSPNALGSTLGGTAQSGTSEVRLSGGVTVAAEPLTINGGGITNLGALRSFSGDNTYSGKITMAAQSRINADAGTLTLNGPVAVAASNFTLVVGGAGNVTISGDLALGTGGVSKADASALNLTGTYSYKGSTSVSGGGTINYSGVNNYTGVGEYVIGSGSTGTFNMTGGSLTINSTGVATATSDSGAIFGMRVGNNAAGNGTLNLTGGTLTVEGGGEFLVGYNATASTASSAVGTVTVTGGTLNIGGGSGRIFVGGRTATGTVAGNGTMTVSGSGAVNVASTTVGVPDNAFYLGGYSGNGTLNLIGGTFTTGRQFGRGGTAVSTINLDGGLLKISGPIAVASLIPTGFVVNVMDNGALIETSVTTSANSVCASPLIHSGMSAVDGGLTKSGLGTLSLSGANTYNGPTTITAGTLQLGSASTTGTLATDSAIVTHGTFSVSRTNAVAQGMDFSPSPLTGTGGFAQSGSGTTTLTAANSFTGPTTISAGTLSVATIENIGVASPLGAGDSSSAAGNTASLVFKGGTLAFTSATGSSDRGFTLTGAGTIRQTSSSGTLVFSGEATGTGGLTVTGTASPGNDALGGGTQNVLTLSGNNTNFTGGVNIAVGGLKITNSNGLGSGTKAITMTAGSAGNVNLQLDGSGGAITLPNTFTYNVSNTSSNGNGTFINLAGDNVIEGQINITSGGGGLYANAVGGSLTLAASITATATGRGVALGGAVNGTVTGVISDGATTTGLNIQKSGGGTWTLTGANTFSGVIAIGDGALAVSSINSVVGGSTSSNLGAPTTPTTGTIALGGNSLVLAAPITNQTTTGTLRYTGPGETTDRVLNLAGTTGGGAIEQAGSGLLKFTSAMTATGAGSKTLTLTGTTAGTGEIAGAIVDNLTGTNLTAVEKSGTGTWTLSGANSYTGPTTVTAGTLSLTSAYLADAAAVVIAPGAKLNLNHTSTDIVASLNLGGVVKTSGTYDSTNSGGLITGTGKIQVGISGNYASWATSAGISGEPATGDFDKDGLTNLMEYALGLNPKVGNAMPGTFSGNTLSFTKGAEAFANGDVTYEIEQSTSLGVGTWTVVAPNAPASPTISYTLIAGHPREFARLKVTQAP